MIFAAWLATAYWFIPWLIRGAYRGESLPLLNQLISGQAIHPLEDYLGLWEALAWKFTLGFVLSFFALLIAQRFKTRIQTHFDRLLGPPAYPLRAPTVLLLCVWAGLLTGLAEAIKAVLTYSIKQQPNWAYAFEVIWMAPLAAVGIFVATGFIILLLALGWRSLRSLGVTTFILSVLGCYILLRLLPIGLFPWAALLLSIGLAVQVVRLVAKHSQGFRVLVRRSTLVMATLIVGVAVGFPVSKQLAEKRAMGQLDLARPGLPNILLIILDTVRAQSLSLHGYERNTSPHLVRLAETGAVFERAVAPSSWTLPSHASLFTGRHPFELAVDWEVPLNDRFPTLAEVVRESGYATAGFVANYFYTKETSGLSRGFIHYDAEKMSPEFVLQNSWAAKKIIKKIHKWLDVHQELARKTAADVNAEFFRWLPTAEGRPFFVFLNYFDAHDPYLPPEPFNARFGTGEQKHWLGSVGPAYSSAELTDLVDAYDGSIAYVDEQVGNLLSALEQSGRLRNTLIIVTSDHGEQFGERSANLVNHGNSLYLSSLHVPLIIWYPAAVPGGQRFSDPVTLRDIPATIADILPIAIGSPFPGTSLAQLWNEPDSTMRRLSPLLSEVNPHDHIQPGEPAHAGPMKALLRDSLHYIRTGDGREELYNVVTDPWERHDLGQTKEGARELPSFRKCLEEMLNVGAMPAAGGPSANPYPSCGGSEVRAASSTVSLRGEAR
jgi:arylsulfatase A-like enzyme